MILNPWQRLICSVLSIGVFKLNRILSVQTDYFVQGGRAMLATVRILHSHYFIRQNGASELT